MHAEGKGGIVTEKTLLYRYDNGKGDTTTIEACIEDGRLIIAGCETGDTVKQFYGDWDYEYWFHADIADCPDDIIDALKGKVTGVSDIKDWFEKNSIKYEFTSYA